jgi:hypothetical protein
MHQAVASDTFWGQRPGEEPFEIHLQIGVPYQVGEEEWACPVALSPLFNSLHDSHGGSSLQALCLASTLALGLLYDFKQKGNAVFHSPGENVDFESYSFNVARSRSGA